MQTKSTHISLMNCFFCGEPTSYNIGGSCDDCSSGFEDRIALTSEPLEQHIVSVKTPLNEMSNDDLNKLFNEAFHYEDAKTMNAVEWEQSRRDTPKVYDIRYL